MKIIHVDLNELLEKVNLKISKVNEIYIFRIYYIGLSSTNII